MSKRKAEVNDIIYELDSEDLSSSSDEDKNAKRTCTEAVKGSETTETKTQELEDQLNTGNTCIPSDLGQENASSTLSENGGKSSSEIQTSKAGEPVSKVEKVTENLDDSVIIIEKNDTIISINDTILSIADDTLTEAELDPVQTDSQKADANPKVDPPANGSSTLILNEEIDTDSQNSPNIPIGCANRSPLVTMTFKNKRLAKDYKQKIKEFMLKLIKLHDEESLTGSESETDLELDIWPEDLTEASVEAETKEEADSLFFVDTDPCLVAHNDVPQYSKADSVLSDKQPEQPASPVQLRRGPTCFNCDGAHQLRECSLPRNNAKINEKRKAVNANRVGRYHVEDDQKFGHLVAGRISGALRHALGLRRDEMPLHIYRMRLLGYPPGWLEEARISHSGITMFDSLGQAIQDPEEEDGEVSEPGSKDKYDIKKILDFPGYNVPPSSRYKEESHRYGLPPMTEEDSKLNMLQVLAPNAMKAYKRKKLTFFPSASSPNCTILGQAEMELDDGDEVAEFPSNPPLPDEAPPPPPETPPPPPPGSPPLPPPGSPPKPPAEETKSEDTKSDDLVMTDVLEVKDIPVPEHVSISLDDDSNTQSSGGRDSPSLQDLETKKRLLLEALDTSIPNSPDVKSKDNVSEVDTENAETVLPKGENTTGSIEVKGVDSPQTSKAGQVKTTSFGTPVLNTASEYLKLPSDNKFAKDICDIINFENLPDSTGKYVKICNMLKRVKGEVDRIQES